MKSHVGKLLLCAVLSLCIGAVHAGESTVKLVLSTVDGSLYHLPFWVAQEKGLLKEAGIEVEYLGFDGGPVQMEAYESWDIGTTGIGGAISGTVGHGGVIIGASLTDAATQNFFARPDSEIVMAGKGHNTVGGNVYGTAETWRGAEILSGYGDVKHYCLIKVLGGFGLGLEDVNVLWMDPSSCITSFFSGQGDAVAVYSTATYSANVQKLVKVIDGKDVDLGLVSYIILNANSMNNPGKAEAIKKAMEIYFECLEWMDKNREETKPYLESFFRYIGFRYSDEVADRYINHEHYYSLQENVESLFAKSKEGDYNVLQEMTVNIIRFYQGFDVYEAGTDERFLDPSHFNFDLLKEIYENK